MLRSMLGYLLSGLAIILPIALMIYAMYYVLSTLDQYFTLFYAILGLIIITVILILVGFMASSYLGGIMWDRTEKLIIKTPFFGMFYKVFKDVTSAFVGSENKFKEPVLATFYENGISKIGFVTNKDKELILGSISNDHSGPDEEMFLVYFPLSFSFSGDLFLVPKSQLKAIPKKAKDVMQSVITGGIIKMK